MQSKDIRQIRNQFRLAKQHNIAKPVSLVAPSEDKTVLFNVAGMQPLVPYLSGKSHPNGKKLYNIQKCIRTNDIEEIGDERHLSMFEMMGNRSLGDYFKKESLIRSREFLTSKEYLGLDPTKIGCSVFGGYKIGEDEIIPYDQEAHDTLLELGMNPKHIKSIAMIQGEKCDNFWGPAGSVGPCGPCAEFHYDRGDAYGKDDWDIGENDRFIEIRNNVFMEFYKDEKGEFTPLSQQNVDTGMGLERLAMVIQHAETIFETDIFHDTMHLIQDFTDSTYPPYTKKDAEMTESEQSVTKSYRIIADHMRAAIFLFSDGVTSSNEGRGYVLRRLIRRAGFHLYKRAPANSSSPKLKVFLQEFTESTFALFDKQYHNINKEDKKTKKEITHRVHQEVEKFLQTIQKGEKKLKKIMGSLTTKTIPGNEIFTLYDTFGFPVELTQEIAEEGGFKIDTEGFTTAMQQAKQKAKADSQNKFSRGVDRAKYLEGIAPTQFIGYDSLQTENPTILKQFQLDDGQTIAIFDRTPFYATGGGQEGDSGIMELDDGSIVRITNVIKYAGVYLHFFAT